MKETLKGIEFSDLESVSFSWPESTEPLSGKGFKNMTITNSQYKELKDFFEIMVLAQVFLILNQ